MCLVQAWTKEDQVTVCSAGTSAQQKGPLCPTSPSDWRHGLQWLFADLNVSVGTGSGAAVQSAFLLADLGAQIFGEINNVLQFYTSNIFFIFWNPFTLCGIGKQKLVGNLWCLPPWHETSGPSPTLISTLWKDPEVSGFCICVCK